MWEPPTCRAALPRGDRRSRSSWISTSYVPPEGSGCNRGRSFSRLADIAGSVLVVLLVLAAATGSAFALELAEVGKGANEDDTWTELESGLAELRERRLPAVVWYPGRGLTNRSPWEDTLSERRVERALSRFVLIRLRADDLSAKYPPRDGDEEAPRGRRRGDAEKDGKRRGARRDEADRGEKDARKPRGASGDDGPQGGSEDAGGGAEEGDGNDDKAGPPDRAKALDGDPQRDLPPVREVLRLPEGPGALLVLDFRERIVRRYAGQTLPKPAGLAKELGRIWRQNAYHVRLAAKVEPVLAASKRAFRAKKVRKAVKAVLPLENDDLQAKLDPVLRSRVQRLLQDYRARGEKALREARKLFDEGKKTPNQAGVLFTKALRALDGAARDYPFPDVITSVQREKTKILAYMAPGF